MTEPSLRERVVLFVTACPDRSIHEIRGGVMAREVEVRAVVKELVANGMIVGRQPAANHPKVYNLAVAARDRAGRASRRKTQEQLLLAVLADGAWHSSEELYRRVPCIVHSRIARMRKRHTIEHSGGGQGAENHFYRLIATSEAADGGQTLSAASGVPAQPIPPVLSDGAPVQLQVGEAA